MKLILGLFGILLLIVIIGTYSKGFLFGKLGFNSPTATIDKQTYNLTEAKTQSELETGLSKTQSLPQNSAMVFLFPKKDTYSFWMKNMKFPIDIIYISNNKIIKIFPNLQPPPSGVADNQIPTVTPPSPADTVLEINAGQSSKYGFKAGDNVTFKNL